MQCHGHKAHHFDPVVALVQMGALMGQDLLLGVPGHAGGYVDFRLHKAKYKGGFDFVRFPAPGYLHRVPHLALELDIGHGADDADDSGHSAPQEQQGKVGVDGNGNGEARGLEAEPTGHGNGHQQPDASQHPEIADELSWGFPQ